MNQEGDFIKNGIKYILLAAAVVLMIALLSVIPRREDRHDTWLVEVNIIEKVITEMDGKQVYLLRTEDRNGEEAIYEINQNAIHDTLTIEGVYDEIKTDHVYQFRVAPKDTYDGHYPAVCGAVSRIAGFTAETSAQDQK